MYPFKSYFILDISLDPSLCYLIDLTNKPFEKQLISYKFIYRLSISDILPLAQLI